MANGLSMLAPKYCSSSKIKIDVRLRPALLKDQFSKIPKF